VCGPDNIKPGISVYIIRRILCYDKEVKMDQILGFVANVGFPIVLSVYLLVRIEGKLDDLSRSIQELARAVAASE